MIVVSDTSPLHYLILIGTVDVLAHLYGHVILPGAVYAELTHPNTPEPVRLWASRLPNWVEIGRVENPDMSIPLDPGEQEAITLAASLRAEKLLVDDLKARRVARDRGLGMTGTLGILAAAAERGLVNLPTAIERLRQTNFHVDPRLLQTLLEQP